MEEQARFEARAVLAPRRARLSRLALLLPVAALLAVAWAGVSDPRSDPATAANPDPTAAAVPTVAAAPTPDIGSTVSAAPSVVVGPSRHRPGQVIGIDVQRFDGVQPWFLGRDDVIAVAGWYIATAITDCPPLAAIYRDGSLPRVRGVPDEWAYCKRSGVLFASRPDPAESRSGYRGIPQVGVTLAVGIVAPLELEMVGGSPTEVVVIGRFVETADGCGEPVACNTELVVDHVGWAAGG
jgi:hypothetical protein